MGIESNEVMDDLKNREEGKSYFTFHKTQTFQGEKLGYKNVDPAKSKCRPVSGGEIIDGKVIVGGDSVLMEIPTKQYDERQAAKNAKDKAALDNVKKQARAQGLEEVGFNDTKKGVTIAHPGLK